MSAEMLDADSLRDGRREVLQKKDDEMCSYCGSSVNDTERTLLVCDKS